MADHWIENHKRDSWRRQAKSSGYRARSAFKLLQIQEKFKLIRESDVVLDVGCHPGGWSQVAVELVGPEGVVSLTKFLWLVERLVSFSSSHSAIVGIQPPNGVFQSDTSAQEGNTRITVNQPQHRRGAGRASACPHAGHIRSAGYTCM